MQTVEHYLIIQNMTTERNLHYNPQMYSCRCSGKTLEPPKSVHGGDEQEQLHLQNNFFVMEISCEHQY